MEPFTHIGKIKFIKVAGLDRKKISSILLTIVVSRLYIRSRLTVFQNREKTLVVTGGTHLSSRIKDISLISQTGISSFLLFCTNFVPFAGRGGANLNTKLQHMDHTSWCV